MSIRNLNILSKPGSIALIGDHPPRGGSPDHSLFISGFVLTISLLSRCCDYASFSSSSGARKPMTRV